MQREPKGLTLRSSPTGILVGYEVMDFPLEITALNQTLLAWEHTYNNIRPHQTLDWKTPMEYICVRILRMLSIRRK